jgi:sugar/nucleoside kinase (ribokinase family)
VSSPHILCVGDIVSGAFITLSQEYATVTTDEKGYKRLSFELGAKLPYDGLDAVKAVECSPNAAVSISRLGLSVSLMAWLGDDKVGQEMIDYLKGQGVDTSDMAVEAGLKSNYHFYLRYGADRTKLQKFEDYSYAWHEPATKPDWLYLGVLGKNTWPLHESMLAYLENNPDIKLAFQPGMYHLMWGAEKMAPFYKRANIVVLNREEATQVTGKDHSDLPGLIQGLHDMGVNVAVITDGPAGAYASDGQRTLFMPIYPDPKEPFDRTGAGDAFASTLTAALAQGETLETALTLAPINSMNVSQYIGAQEGLLTREQLEKLLESAPENYKVQEYQPTSPK